jgi:hypothetical protein
MAVDRRQEWRPNANEAPVMADLDMGVANVGTVGSLGWAGLRWLAARLGLPVPAPRPDPDAPTSPACPRCRAPTFAGEAACTACGRALPPAAATTAAQIAALAAADDHRRRRDLLVALLAGVLLGLGILVIARTMERGHVQTLALQLWWLAGLFWGAFVYVARRWLDQ